ncbi:MAG: Uma2 family endonuclease [Minicystis sp.]
MGRRIEEQQRRATYADYAAVPSHLRAELIGGTLRVMPRPAPREARASTRLTVQICGPFDLGRGGPGGWHILDEPELHFPDPSAPGEKDVVVPDLAGWRLEHTPELPEEAHFTLAPDWICEVLSKSTEDTDRNEKMPIYTREGVRHAWLIDPVKKTLEVFALGAKRQWEAIAAHEGYARVRAVPFEVVEVDLSVLWV